MSQTRREFLATTTATAAIALLPYGARAASGSSDVFQTAGGEIKVHPVSHASFVMETPAGTIYSDPVGGASAYADYPAPDLILVTHRHGDHYDADTLSALTSDGTEIVTCADVQAMMPDELKEKARILDHDESIDWQGVTIKAIPAYNMTEGRLDFHPKERGDNGYVLSFEGFRVYISGDTEDIPEMRALEDIDLAFICMNLPFTMTSDAAASAVAEFMPTYVYPYHYRGRDGGTQNPEDFAEQVGDAATVRLVDWYPDNEDL